MKYFRAIADVELRQMQATGKIPPSPNEKPPYGAGAVVYLLSEDAPPEYVQAYGEDAVDRTVLFSEPKVDTLHVIAITLTPEQQAKVEVDKSAPGVPYHFVHPGAIDVNGRFEVLVAVSSSLSRDDRNSAIETAIEAAKGK